MTGDPAGRPTRLPYARTLDDRQPSPNLNYGRATAWQDPIRVRLGVALSF